MDFGHFAKEMNRTADAIAPAYKAGTLAAIPVVVPAVLSMLGAPGFLAPVAVPIVEAAVAALPAREVLALGLAPSTGGASLFLFTTK